MPLERLFLNDRVEAWDPVFDLDCERQYRTLGRIYNRSLGPVTTLTLYKPELVDPSVYSAVCAHAPLGALLRDLRVRKGVAEDSTLVPGGGKGPAIQRALLGSLGEAGERLLTVLSSSRSMDDAVYASYDDLVADGRAALGPDRLPLFAPEQYAQPEFPYQPLRPDVPIAWVEAADLLSSEPVLVPAQLVLFNWTPRPAEARVGYATSGGLAFHVDRRRAVLRGLCEVIERDAINVRWYSQLPPPVLDVDVEALLSTLLPTPFRLSTAEIGPIRAFLNTVDVPVPVFTAMATPRAAGDGPFLSGGGAGVSRADALLQAVMEVGQTCTALRLLGPHGVGPDMPVAAMNDFHHAVLFYGYEKNRWRTAWYTAGQQVVGWDDVPELTDDDDNEAYDRLLAVLSEQGIRPVVLDLNADGWSGVSVVKVLVPELTQAGIPSRPFLGHPRYYELPERLGLRDRRLEFADLSTYPPPLP